MLRLVGTRTGFPARERPAKHWRFSTADSCYLLKQGSGKGRGRPYDLDESDGFPDPAPSDFRMGKIWK